MIKKMTKMKQNSAATNISRSLLTGPSNIHEQILAQAIDGAIEVDGLATLRVTTLEPSLPPFSLICCVHQCRTHTPARNRQKAGRS